MEEMLEETLEMEEDEELEEEADAEVDKVLFELTNGKLGEAGAVGTGLPVCSDSLYEIRSTNNSQLMDNKLEEEETERTMEKYRQQLNGLLS